MAPVELFVSALVFVAGLWLVWLVLLSATRTIVLPRGVRDRITLTVFDVTRVLFGLIMARTRAGYLAFRSIGAFFGVDYNPDPKYPGDAISVTREEFVAVYAEVVAAGAPVVADRDQAWRDFAGWRVNYDVVPVELTSMTMAPSVPWSSDWAQWRAARDVVWQTQDEEVSPAHTGRSSHS